MNHSIEGTAESNERRLTNRAIGIVLAKTGVPVFVSDGKKPLIKGYTRLDTSFTPEERDAITEAYRDSHGGRDPVHIGCTTNVEAIKKMFNHYPDGVTSISCGPAGLTVLDADSKDDGPAKLAAFFNENGGRPNGAVVVETQSKGQHIYMRNDGTFTNKAGLLKRQYGTDVRGVGGQTVAPGSVRMDGKVYGGKKDRIAFCKAFKDGSLPAVPDFVREAIGQSNEGEQPLNDADPTVKNLIAELADGKREDFASLFDPTVGKYPLDYIRECRPDLWFFLKHPGADCSANRMKVACCLVGAFPELTISDYAVFCGDWDGAGEYDDRALAREFAKAKRTPTNMSRLSNGDAFEAVDDEDDGPEIARRSGSHVRDSYLVANYTPIRWLVKRMIPLNSVGALYGLPNVGKSFVVFDLASHARRGREWFGRKTLQGDVLYLFAEGAEGVAGRAKAWAEHNDPSGGSVAIQGRVPNLFSDKNAAKKIVAAARACEAESGEPVRLIVVDTLAVAAAGAEENSTPDMTLVFDRLRKVANELDCSVLVVHHAGKDVKRGMRGSSAILGAVDFSLMVDEAGGVSSISVQKMRDARKGQSLRFKLVEVVIGKDADGENVTSCIVRPVTIGDNVDMTVDDSDDDATLTPPDTPADKLSATLRVFKERVESLSATMGEPISEIGVTAKEIFSALNRDRRASGLAEIKDRTVIPRLLGRLVEGGEIVKSGDNRRTEYRLADG